jgi:hypothetical protein
MRLAKNESRFIGTTFEALVELPLKRKRNGVVTLAESERSEDRSESGIIPEAEWDNEKPFKRSALELDV